MTPRAKALAPAVACLLLLAGCGSAGSGSSGGAGKPVAATQAASPAAGSTSGTSDVSGHAGHTVLTSAGNMKLGKGERFTELSMDTPYTPAPPSGGTDDYRCFIVDPGITSTSYLTGTQFLPNNPEIVHHAIFFKLEKKDQAAARTLDAASPGEGWTCFSGTGIGGPAGQLGGQPWLGAWAPGGGASLAAEGTGYRLDPGTQIILQIHYNLLATGGKATGTDQSGVRLRIAPGEADLVPLHTTLLPAPVELPCPAGETGRLCDRTMSLLDEMHRFGNDAGFTVGGLNLLCNGGRTPTPSATTHCDRTMHHDMVVYAVAGHMHLLGKSIKVDLDPGTKHAKNLLDVPVYDFDDQGAHMLTKPVTVKPGDDLRVTCTHDATLRSKLPALHTLPPRYVLWGEGTSDEMCLGVVVWADHAPA